MKTLLLLVSILLPFLASAEAPLCRPDLITDAFQQITQSTCEAILKSKACQDLYAKMSAEDIKSKALSCSNNKTPLDPIKNGWDFYSGCYIGGLTYAYESRKALLDMANSAGQGMVAGVTSIIEAREENALCDLDPAAKLNLIKAYNDNSPELLKFKEPSAKYLARADCAAVKATLKAYRDQKMNDVGGAIWRKQAAKKSLGAAENEFVKFRNSLSQGQGLNLVALTQEKLKEMGIQIECYNSFSAAVITCETAATIGTLAAGPAGAAIKAAKLSRVARLAGISKQAEEAEIAELMKQVAAKSKMSDEQAQVARLKARVDEISAKGWSTTLQEKVELSNARKNLKELENRLAAERGGPAKIEIKNGNINANDVMVSGYQHYPLEVVKRNLALEDKVLNRLPEDANILSIGEGMSDLAPTLAKKFPNTKAVDIWYGNSDLPKDLAQYAKENQKLLLTGSSTKLPVPDRSQDLVVSHKLFNNLPEEAVEQSMNEILRVLKPGGTARFTLTDSPEAEELVKKFVASHPGQFKLESSRPSNDSSLLIQLRRTGP